MRHHLLAASLLLVLGLAACGGDDAGTPVAAGGDLSGRTFLSVSAEPPLVPDTRVQLRFDGDRLGATAGCNGLGGTWSTEGDVLVVDTLSMTEIGCDPARHDQDQWLADLLTARPRYEVAGDELRLTSGPSRLTLVDREVADPDRPLEGTQWRLDGLVDGEVASSVPQGVEVTVAFDGRHVAVTGCNGAGGPYAVEGDTIRFGQLVTTDVACAEPAAGVESHVHGVLSGAVPFEIEADLLRLTHPDGKGITLRG